MSKWSTQEGMETIMSLKGINRIRLLFDEVFPNALPLENATYGRLNKDSSIALLKVKVGENTFAQTEGDDNDTIIICGVAFNWNLFSCSISTKVSTVNDQEKEALRNLWAYTTALRKAHSLILARHQEIGYDALDCIHRVLLIVYRVLGSYLDVDKVISDANHEIRSLIASDTRVWRKNTVDRMLSRYVVNNVGIAQREIDPKDTVVVLASMQKHATNTDVIVIEDRVSSIKPIVKVIDLKVSYAYIESRLNELIEDYKIDASELKGPLNDVVKGMVLIYLFQKHVDNVGRHDGLNDIKNSMVRRFTCGHLNLIKPTLVRISEKASRLAEEIGL